MKIRAVVLSLAMSLAGCFIYRQYPEPWASVADSANCVDVSGTFESVGESAMKELGPAALATLLFVESNHGDRVRITNKDDKAILFEEFESGTLVATHELPGECQADGYFTVSKPSGFVGGQGGVGYSWNELQFKRAVDGALIVRTVSGGVGLVFLVIPAFGSEHRWFRFANAGKP